MTLSTSALRPRSALALAAAGLAVLLASADARTAGSRPLFQMPVACGQTWHASTYTGHWNGDHDAIDLAQRDRDLDNLSNGEPALAAAAGTVKKVYKESNGEYRVYLDHGGGWETHYIHLESLPPLAVGQHVAQGEVVGRISNSGAESPHLHYNQIADGDALRVYFNGKAIKTHAENAASYDTYGKDTAEKLTSMNCPGNSFIPFTMNGARYLFLYKPGVVEGPGGPAKIVRLRPDGKGVTTTFSGYLGLRNTHLVPFTIGLQQFFFSYAHATGDVRFFRFNLKGEGATLLSSGKWWKGWTSFTPFSLGGDAYFLAYDSLNGYANIDRVHPDGSGSTKIYGSTWTKGYTHVVPYVMGPSRYLLLYKGGTGAAKVLKLSGGGNGVSFTEVWSGTWSPGWTQLVPLKHKGTVRLLAYRMATGEVSYGKLRPNGQGSQHLASATWNGIWTAFTPFLQDGSGAVLIYRADTGTAEVRVLNDAGTGSAGIWLGAWTTGWS